MGPKRVVIVGGSAAGARAAATILDSGYSGQVDVISRDLQAPYYRPALSKQLLSGTWSRDKALQTVPPVENLVWHSGSAATGLDTAGKKILLDTGAELDFTSLILAGGCRPRTISDASVSNVPVLATMDDAKEFAEMLSDYKHIIVIGAGLIGSEVASTIVSRGLHVTLVDPLEEPLARALGPFGNNICLEQHLSYGIDLRLGALVESIVAESQSVKVSLQSGETLIGDQAISCIGVAPDTDWLIGSGIPILPDGSIDCDDNLIVKGFEDIAAAGDIATWYSSRLGAKTRIEHWVSAVEQGAAAARNILSPYAKREKFDGVPFFWTEQHDNIIHALGHSNQDSKWHVVEGEAGQSGMVAAATNEGDVTGYMLFNAPRRVGFYRQQLF